MAAADLVDEIEAIETFVRPLYAHKDTLHGLPHIRRVVAEAHALARPYPEADALVLLYGAYLHGIVWHTDEARLVAFLQVQGLPAATVRRVLAAAWASQKDRTPDTLEGRILHDAHLLEGGRTFIIVKSLVVGAERGQPLEASLAYIEEQVLGRYRCFLPEAQPRYAAKEAFARAFLADLKAHL